MPPQVDRHFFLTLPLLVAGFQERGEGERPGSDAGATPARTIPRDDDGNKRFITAGFPLLAVLWEGDTANPRLKACLSEAEVPWVTIKPDNPISWARAAVKRAYESRTHDGRIYLVSDSQAQIAHVLHQVNLRLNAFGSLERSVFIQQEVKLSSVIQSSDSEERGMLTGGSLDFVVSSRTKDQRAEGGMKSGAWLPVLAIEYNGWHNHAQTSQRRRDKKKDEICLKAGLPLLRLTKEFLPPDARYPAKTTSGAQAREMRSQAILDLIVRTLHAWERGYERRFRKALDMAKDTATGSQEERAGRLARAFGELMEEESMDQFVDQHMALVDLKRLTGVDARISIEEHYAPRRPPPDSRISSRQPNQKLDSLQAVLIDNQSDRVLIRTPPLKLLLTAATFTLQPRKVAERILVNWALDREYERHSIDRYEAGS